jgi:hypothetical protein
MRYIPVQLTVSQQCDSQLVDSESAATELQPLRRERQAVDLAVLDEGRKDLALPLHLDELADAEVAGRGPQDAASSAVSAP